MQDLSYWEVSLSCKLKKGMLEWFSNHKKTVIIVLGGVTICDNVLFEASAVVNKNIDEPQVYVNVPVMKIK